MSDSNQVPTPDACIDAVWLAQYVDGTLSQSERDRIESHLSRCAACRLQVEAADGDSAAIFARVRNAFPEQAPAANSVNGNNAAEATLDAGAPIGKSRSPARLPHIDGYETVRELHRGGQGIVFQAIQKSTKRKVAIKVLLEGAYASGAARRRFEREIELVAQLKHPNIIEIFHSGETPDDHAYCVMDYVRGNRLDQFVRDKKLNLEQALQLFIQICSAVNYAHQKGVIHRDLKPSNILVDVDATPKVLDFGLAKQAVSPAESLVSITGQVVGTLPYMSPEQARGNPDEIDTRTDIYALGVILYELLTGEYPYPVLGQMAEVLKHIADTPPTPPSRSWTSTSGITTRHDRRVKAGQCPIDDELQTIVLKALSKERARRYQSAGELGEDLQRYLDGEPIEAKKDSGWYVLKKNLRRHRLALRVAAAFVIVLTGAVIVSGLGWRRAAQHAASAEFRLQSARLEADITVDDLAQLISRAQAADEMEGFLPINVAQHFEERPLGDIKKIMSQLEPLPAPNNLRRLAKQPQLELSENLPRSESTREWVKRNRSVFAKLLSFCLQNRVRILKNDPSTRLLREKTIDARHITSACTALQALSICRYFDGETDAALKALDAARFLSRNPGQNIWFFTRRMELDLRRGIYQQLAWMAYDNSKNGAPVDPFARYIAEDPHIAGLLWSLYADQQRQLQGIHESFDDEGSIGIQWHNTEFKTQPYSCIRKQTATYQDTIAAFYQLKKLQIDLDEASFSEIDAYNDHYLAVQKDPKVVDIFFVNMTATFRSKRCTEMLRDATILTIAAIQYKWQNNQWPNSPDDALANFPIQPKRKIYYGDELKMTVNDNKLLIYAVGLNELDERSQGDDVILINLGK